MHYYYCVTVTVAMLSNVDLGHNFDGLLRHRRKSPQKNLENKCYSRMFGMLYKEHKTNEYEW